MANIIVVSPSLSTEAGDSGDLIVFRSGAISGASVIGGAGADSLEMVAPTTSANGVDVSLKGGADLATVSSVAFSGASFALGAGGDTLALTGTDGVINTILGGAGSDVIQLHTGSEFSAVKLGAGADLISGIGNISADTGFIGLGAGADTLTLSATTFQEGTIFGGGGSDLINLDAVASAGEVVIRGDATGYTGNDTINLSSEFVSGSVEGGLGADVIKLVGTAVGKSEYLGNGGADQINFSGAVFGADTSGTTIGGGAGADTIEFGEVGSAGSGALVFGGGGADSIILDANAAVTAGGASFSAGIGLATIAGGAGADSITFSGALNAASAGVAGVLSWSSNSDSTADAVDIVSFNATAGMGSFFLVDADATGVANGERGNIDVSAGVMVTAGGASSLSDRISAIDSVLVTGQLAVFSDTSASAAYLFVQGGSTDLVAKFSNADAKIATAGSFTVSAAGSGQFKIGFNA
jgi:hypothetical protein